MNDFSSPTAKALAIFKVLKARAALSQTELVQVTGLGRTSVRRSLEDLVGAGLTRRRLDGKFALTAFADGATGPEAEFRNALTEYVADFLRDNLDSRHFGCIVAVRDVHGRISAGECTLPPSEFMAIPIEFCDASHAAFSLLSPNELETCLEHVQRAERLDDATVDTMRETVNYCRARGYLWSAERGHGAIPIHREDDLLFAVAIEKRTTLEVSSEEAVELLKSTQAAAREQIERWLG